MNEKKKQLDEKRDRETIETFYKKANDVRSPEQLASFVKSLLGDYQHDYGSIVHACAASAIAACRAVDRDPNSGGITGFQAGCVMWEFISRFLYKKGPMRLVEYKNMLYPQYESEFTSRTITKDTWEWLQKEAKKQLGDTTFTSEEVLAHLRSIADGKVPFCYQVEAEEQ